MEIGEKQEYDLSSYKKSQFLHNDLICLTVVSDNLSFVNFEYRLSTVLSHWIFSRKIMCMTGTRRERSQAMNHVSMSVAFGNVCVCVTERGSRVCRHYSAASLQ